MVEKVVVKQHIRKRHGRTAELARKWGIDPEVNIDPYERRRPVFHKRIVPPAGWETIGRGYWERIYPKRHYLGAISESRGQFHWSLHDRRLRKLITEAKTPTGFDIVRSGVSPTLVDAAFEVDRVYQAEIGHYLLLDFDTD